MSGNNNQVKPSNYNNIGLKSNKLGDSLFGADILSQTNFKPWWETVRFFAVVGIYVVSVMIILAMNPATSLVCLPTDNTSSQYTLIGSDHVSLHCSKFDPSGSFFRNIGYILLSACIFLHVLHTWWLFVPRVRHAFRSLRQIDDIVDQIKEVDSAIKDDKARGDDEDLKTEEMKRTELEEGESNTIDKMNRYKPWMQYSVPAIYILSNTLALIAIPIDFYILYYIINFKQVPFSCTIQSLKAQCHYDVIDQLTPCVIFGMVLLSVDGIVSLIAAVATALGYCTGDLPPVLENVICKQDYTFAAFFGEHSTPIIASAELLMKDIAFSGSWSSKKGDSRRETGTSTETQSLMPK